VRAEARHHLKEDQFSKLTMRAAERTVHWSAEHKLKLALFAGAALIVAGLVLGGWYYLNQQDQKASFQLGQAVRTLDTPLRPAGSPPQPEFPSFTSSKERATAAHKQFQEIADQYPHTKSAEFARYFVGVTDVDLGETAAATQQLQSVAESHNDGLASLAKLALASVYRGQHDEKKAIDIYNALIAKPTRTVSKVTAQIELASTYEESGQTAEAKRVYQQVQKDNPSTAVAQLAGEKLQSLK
jgi:predicted negative regulator of RcsB-dependent stress response